MSSTFSNAKRSEGSDVTRRVAIYKTLIEARTEELPYFQVIAFVVRDETDLQRAALWPRIDDWLRNVRSELVDIDDAETGPINPNKVPERIASGDADIAEMSGRLYHGPRPSPLVRLWRSLFGSAK